MQVGDAMEDAGHGTFVLKPGPARLVLTSAGLILPACVFLFLAAVVAMIEVDNALGRAALLLAALALVGLAAFFLLSLSQNAIRIEVGPERLKLRLPRMRGPLMLPSLVRAELPYSSIAAVERRDEIYSSFGMVTVQDAFSLVTRDGARFPLGTMAENWGSQLRFDQAAERIAQRAGATVTDRGAVRVGGILRAIVRGTPAWGSETLTPVERNIWHARSVRTLRILGLIIALLAVARACAR
jgi:hypothetical protein